MENPLNGMTKEIKEALEKNDQALAASKIRKYLKNVNSIPLNIVITGESGSGKSSFVNAFRGVDDMDERAAPTGCVETTVEVKDYLHPRYPNVTLWDLPGLGTTNFPADKYLQHVGFEKFDFFIIIIISDTRFRENDVKLALEIRRMKFYFVRSKIDNDLRAEERRRDFDAEKTLAKIKDNCIQGLQNQGVMFPQVFLLSSFPLLHETLEKELPAHKKNALLFAMPNISLKIINKKKEAFQEQIKYYALLSAAVAALPIPGLSLALDVSVLVNVVKDYIDGFGLDSESLQRLADSTRVPLEDLKAVIMSPLGLEPATPGLVMKLVSQCAVINALLAAGEGLRYIPILGTIVAASSAFLASKEALDTFLNSLAEDAQRVFKKAMGLND